MKLFIIYISQINLIIISFPLEVSPFIKKEKVIYLLIKYRFKLISRKVIEVKYLLIKNKGVNLFKNTRFFIFIKYLIFKYLNFIEVF